MSSRRIKIPAAVRNYVLQRDQYQCQSCGATQNLTIDHIIPLVQGGTDDLSNLQTLCSSCNSHKQDHFDPQFRRRYR